MNLTELHYILNHWRGILKVMEQDWQNAASENGLTMAEQHILWILHFETEATMTEIADLGLWDVSTVMQVVKRLKEKGLVTSKKMAHDRRISYVELTEEGKIKRKATEKYNFRIFEYLKKLKESDEKGEEFISELLLRQKDMSEYFHGKKFVDWVDKTAKQIENETTN